MTYALRSELLVPFGISISIGVCLDSHNEA
jgi:hypothetical protein